MELSLSEIIWLNPRAAGARSKGGSVISGRQSTPAKLQRTHCSQRVCERRADHAYPCR